MLGLSRTHKKNLAEGHSPWSGNFRRKKNTHTQKLFFLLLPGALVYDGSSLSASLAGMKDTLTDSPAALGQHSKPPGHVAYSALLT